MNTSSQLIECKSNKSSEKFEVNEVFLHISEQIKAEKSGKTLEETVNFIISKLDANDFMSKKLPCLKYSIGMINRFIEADLSEKLISISEHMQERAIAVFADKIVKRDKVKVVLIAGPSSSGKTTFSKKLGQALEVYGKKPFAISLDDYFVSRDRTPKDENGEYDYESIYAEDIDLFQTQLTQMLAGEEVELPRYDFPTGMSVKSGKTLRLDEESVLIIEGIHGLNPILTGSIPDENLFRIYISALTVCKQPNGSYYPTTDNRLVRRIVRDSKYRNATAQATIARWPSVRRGEEKWIVPFQENADVNFNSAFQYELALLKVHALPLLYNVHEDEPEYAEAQRLITVLEDFNEMDIDLLPPYSLLREFLGGSKFEY